MLCALSPSKPLTSALRQEWSVWHLNMCLNSSWCDGGLGEWVGMVWSDEEKTKKTCKCISLWVDLIVYLWAFSCWKGCLENIAVKWLRTWADGEMIYVCTPITSWWCFWLHCALLFSPQYLPTVQDWVTRDVLGELWTRMLLEKVVLRNKKMLEVVCMDGLNKHWW